jgi:hypothetical protein
LRQAAKSRENGDEILRVKGWNATRAWPEEMKQCMGSPCSKKLHETGELTLNSRKKAGWLRKLPTPVLSGSGSRVYLSPTPWSTPVSI